MTTEEYVRQIVADFVFKIAMVMAERDALEAKVKALEAERAEVERG